ncbi:unnamed protein product [Rotaria sp. Silwood2]|nr:unnamed protein product [Rotaria sp. Silwood2]
MESVSCIGKNETNNTFVDWSAFTSVDHRRYSFTFLNLTRLTYLTFTNFSSTFPRNDLTLSFTFINGLDEIGENTFQELNYYSDEPVDMTFTSPRNFKLVDYAFGRAEYFEIVIDSIQYSHINNLPYKFNLKSMDGIKFYQMSIINSGQVYFVSNGSSAIELTEITVVNCSLTNASLLIESFSTSIVDLDLSSNQLIEIPSMMKFQEMREIDLKNNLIEEITSNIFNNMINLNHLDLSNNRIRTIAADSFIGIGFLITLAIDNNFLTSLETITIDNRTTSFLHPLNKSLAFFSASNNFIRDLYPLKHMINLDNVTLCCNQIRTIEANTFGEASQLRTVDLSYNKIESIDSMAFNGTVINNLNLAGNPILSLETNFQEVQNQTTSFLYTVSATLFSLSISNCTNFIELNWFVISKLEILSNLELSQLNKTHKFWLYRKTDTNNEDSPINWNFPPHVILNGIRFTDNDYCLTKSIAHLLNRTTLIVDIDHPCNCFIFKFSDSFDKDQRPVYHHGRILSTVFLTLPSKIDYPDYYEIIQRPIDLKRIESRQYSSINDLSNDLQLMLDNACLYNEPGSTIYRDALSLQLILINQRKKLTNAEFNVNNVQNLVQDLLWDLFIQTFNAEDSNGRFYTDSFAEYSEQTDNEPFDIVYTYDLIKQNLNQRRYRRLDIFQDDLFKVYQDTIELQKYYIRLRDEICSHGNLLHSPALLFNENSLQQKLVCERSEKDALTNNNNNQNSISTIKSSDTDENQESSTKFTLSTENSSLSKGETFYIGDFVYIEPNDETSEAHIICIESFEHKDNEDYFNGLQFYRPNETYHLPTKKFLRQEVFLTQTIEHIPMNKIQGLCHVLLYDTFFLNNPQLLLLLLLLPS